MHMKGGGAIQNPTEPGESGSCRDRERPRDNAVPSSRFDCADDPPGRPGPRGPIAASAGPHLRALVYGGGLDMSSTCLPTPVWPCQVSCQLCESVSCTWMPWLLQLEDRHPNSVPQPPDAKSTLLWRSAKEE